MGAFESCALSSLLGNTPAFAALRHPVMSVHVMTLLYYIFEPITETCVRCHGHFASATRRRRSRCGQHAVLLPVALHLSLASDLRARALVVPSRIV